MLPFFVQSFKTPPDRVFMGLHRWSEDYYGYLHSINQGLMGHIKIENKLTLIPHPPTYIHSEYAFLGLVGRFFSLNSVLVYHLSRLVLGAIYLFTAFYFFYFLFNLFFTASAKNYKLKIINYASLAFFFSFFVPGFPKIFVTPNFPFFASNFEPFLKWWVELDVVRRATILPHYIMGDIFFLTTTIYFLKTPSKKDFTSRFLLFISSLLLSFVHPIDYLILTGTVFLFFVINLFKKKSFFFPLLTIILAGLIPFLYYRRVFALPFYRFVTEHGTTTGYHIPVWDFILAHGPVFFLAAGAIFLLGKNIRRLSDPVLFLFSWTIVQTAFFLKLFEVFNFDRLRTLHAPYYLPLAFFATIFIFKIKNVFKISNFHFKIISFAACFLFAFPLYFSVKNQIYEVSDFKTFSPFVYPSRKQYEAYLFLRNNTPKNSPITAMYETKFLLPAVSGNKIAFGANFENDKNYDASASMINKLYSGQTDSDSAYKFLSENKIAYVYWGYQEKSFGGDLNKFTFLQKIFDNGEVGVFAVK
jgi:hypothetical protein